MNRISKLFAMSVLTIALVGAGCGDDGSGPSGPGPYDALTVELYDTGHLANGYFYELWVANSDAVLSSSSEVSWISVMEFNLNPAAGNDVPAVITSITGQVIEDNTFKNLSVDFEDYDTLLISVEAPGASSGLPSSTVIAVVGIPSDFSQQAIVGLEFPADFDSSLSVPNSFQFATPTDADTSNELSGVWFALNVDDTPRQSLRLKYAPAGWIYEGWAWHENTWLSTGKFLNPGDADEFSEYSLGPGIGYPGEDFLDDANAPAGVTFPWTFGEGDSVMITLEPMPDPETAPYSVRLFGLGLANDRPPHVDNIMVSPKTTPNGSVTFYRTEEL